MVGVRRVVDVHAHAVPLPLLTWLEQHGRADLSGTERGVVVIDPEVSGVAPGTALPLPASMHRPELRLEEMAATGVTHEAVSLPPFLFATRSLDEALVRETTARGNDALASYCSHDPDHLLALGNVPQAFRVLFQRHDEIHQGQPDTHERPLLSVDVRGER